MFLRFYLYVAKILILGFGFVPLLLFHLQCAVCPPSGNTFENCGMDRDLPEVLGSANFSQGNNITNTV